MMVCTISLLCARGARAPTSYREMTRMTAMDDTAALGMLLVDQLEWRYSDGLNSVHWDAQGWYGTDYNKLWLKTEGKRSGGVTQDGRAELLWDRIFSRWWSAQAGVRHDFGDGPSRDWLALGVEGLAPYFFNIEATAYLGDAGRTAARFRAEYELLFTQRLILQPRFEATAYGKDDPQRQIGAGLSDLQLGLRVRYEIRREFAPYLGVVWERSLGKTADLVRASGKDPSDFQVLAGIRFWF
jgi:copper resistance protein B